MSDVGRPARSREERAFKAKAELIDRLIAATEKALDAVTEVSCAGAAAYEIHQKLVEAAQDTVVLASKIATSDEALITTYEARIGALAGRVASAR